MNKQIFAKTSTGILDYNILKPVTQLSKPILMQLMQKIATNYYISANEPTKNAGKIKNKKINKF